jgi:hypothetical protein
LPALGASDAVYYEVVATIRGTWLAFAFVRQSLQAPCVRDGEFEWFEVGAVVNVATDQTRVSVETRHHATTATATSEAYLSFDHADFLQS